ncbi:MAG: aspartyl protease family protein [Planctomycetota bacterium]|jgi:predicted aspartyl protease
MSRRLLLALFVLALGCGGAVPRGGRGGGGGNLDRALQLYFKRDLDGAKSELERAGDDQTALRFLGRIHLMRNEPREATKLFKRAIEMTREDRAIDTFLLQDALWARIRADDYAGACRGYEILGSRALAERAAELYRNVAYAVSWEGDATLAKFEFTDPVAAVPVRINGPNEGVFVVDTTVSDLVLDLDFAKAVKLKVTRADRRYGYADEVRIGRVTVRNVPAEVRPLERAGRHRVDGLIGINFLSHFIVRFNFPKGRLELGRLRGEGKPGIPMLFGGDRHLILQGELDGKQAWFLLNTGMSDGEFCASPKFAGPKAVRIGPVSSARPRLSKEKYPIVLDGAVFGFPVEGVVGYPFIDGRTVTLDFRSMHARIE